MPATAFSEELTAHTSEARRWVEPLASKLFLIEIREVKQARLLLITHGSQVGNAELGTLIFDQVMQLNAGFLFTCVVAIKDGVAAGLGFVEMLDG